MASSVPHLHTCATNNSPAYHNYVQHGTFTQLCLIVHWQHWRNHSCAASCSYRAYEMSNTEPNACFATCVNKRACGYKNPVKTFFAFMVSQRNDHIVNVSRLHYSTSLRAVSESLVSSAVGSFEVRGLAALYCTLLKQIHLKSWIRGEFTEAGEACLTRTHTHARPRAHFWTVDFLVPSDWLVSFVYRAMFVIGLYLDYNLFQDFLQTQ